MMSIGVLYLYSRWLGGVVIMVLDLRLSVVGSIPSHDTGQLFLRYVILFGG